MIRLEVDTAFNCRPKKGERRAPDRSGRLMKTSIIFAGTLAEAMAEARAAESGGEKAAPGYAEVIAVRSYDADAFSADPLNAAPDYTAASL